MNLFIVTNPYGNIYDANARIAADLAQHLAKYGVRCHMFASPGKTVLPGIELHLFGADNEASFHSIDPTVRWKSLSFLHKCLLLISHPLRALQLVKARIPTKKGANKLPSYIVEYSENIRSVCAAEKIDAILAIYMPHEILQTFAYETFTVPVFLYQLDPWGLHELELPVKAEERRAEEVAAFAKARHIFTTPVLFELYDKDAQFKPFLSKMTAMAFPVLAEPALCKAPADEMPLDVGTDDYVILYTGTIADHYRSPAFALSVLVSLKKKLPTLKVFFMGISFSEVLTSFAKEHSDFILLIEPQPNEIADCAIQQADALLNIGNALHNQMPSKIIGYVGSGKPIISTAKIIDCPSKEFLGKYPLHIVLDEDEDVDSAANQLQVFCRQTIGKTVSYETVLSLYSDTTPQYAASVIYEVLREELA